MDSNSEFHYPPDPRLSQVLHLLQGLQCQVKELEEKLMKTIAEYAAAVDVHQEHIDIAITGLQGDIAAMKQMITDLQTSQGQLSAEDQATLDRLEARMSAAHEKLDALDALTPPVAPPEPTPPPVTPPVTP